jgi:hypothetical protein
MLNALCCGVRQSAGIVIHLIIIFVWQRDGSREKSLLPFSVDLAARAGDVKNGRK